MAEETKKQKCKVLRSFYYAPGKIAEKGKTIVLDEPFATEMKASLKVEFVGADSKDDEKDDKK